MDSKIKNFFYPSTICIAGASTKEKSIGYELLKSIKEYGYIGKIYPVNPKAKEILQYKCYNSIEEIKDNIDLAIVLVPKAAAEETIDKLLSKNVFSIILVTAGFKEVGKEGAEIEKKILKKALAKGARLTGPNCMGVISTLDDIKLNATFVAERPEKGATGFLSQSGAIAAAILNSLRETDIKFAHMISVGNKADICENDIIAFWQKDDNIKTITCYLESFEKGEELIKLLSNGIITKPVIILKAGKTASGMKAASSHTGALGSNDKVIEAVLNQFGIIRVDTLDELFNTAKGLENFPMPKGNRVAVVTNAGGPAILAVDSIDKAGLVLSSLSNDTKDKLRKIVHPEGSINNPVDLLPGGTAEQYRDVNEILLSDDNVDAIISVFVEPVMVDAFKVIENVNSIKSEKPLFQVVMPLPEFREKYRKHSKTKLPLFRKAEEPAQIISNILFYTNKKQKQPLAVKEKNQGKTDLKNQLTDGWLSTEQINILAENYDLPVVKTLIINPGEINKNDLEYPLVLKGISKNVLHKTEMNAVKINIKNREELASAEMDIKNSFNKINIKPDSFLIQPFLEPMHEILLGGFRDKSFGPMIMFGTGGKYVEVYNDISIKSAYLTPKDIDELIYGTKIGQILKGVRGEEPFNLEKIKKVILSSAQMMIDLTGIKEFDFNPLIATRDQNIFAVDIRIKFSQ
ncbi:MAG: acetate--CoA ligase family protein [Ignavibacteriaceae bacterium]